MTASHMWYDNLSLKFFRYDGMTLDISTNYEDHLNSGKQIEYDIKDKGFQNLMQCVCLGSKAFFSYEPSDAEIINYLAKK
jgi:hypothetical protein